MKALQFAIQSEDLGPAASTSLGSLLKYRISCPTPDLLNHNHFDNSSDLCAVYSLRVTSTGHLKQILKLHCRRPAWIPLPNGAGWYSRLDWGKTIMQTNLSAVSLNQHPTFLLYLGFPPFFLFSSNQSFLLVLPCPAQHTLHNTPNAITPQTTTHQWCPQITFFPNWELRTKT